MGPQGSTILLLGGPGAILGGKKRVPKTTHLSIPTFSTKLTKKASPKGTRGLNFLVPFSLCFARFHQNLPRAPKITKKTNKTKDKRTYFCVLFANFLCYMLQWCSHALWFYGCNRVDKKLHKKRKNSIVAPSLSRIQEHISQAQYPELLSICPKIGCNYFRHELYLPLLLLL